MQNKTAFLTLFALIAFAGNSVLGRAGLIDPQMDAGLFATTRIVSGAVALALLLSIKSGRPTRLPGSTAGGLALFLYAVPFSFAYVGLATGTGALILFGLVQATMIGAALRGGERPSRLKWMGMLAAAAGMVTLVLPGVSAPPLLSAALMALAGISWGIYSLIGKKAVDPLQETAGNFIRATPWTLVATALAIIVGWGRLSLSTTGILLAIASGAVTSGIGYALWYAALPHLKATTAATLQLTVPLLATLGGVLFVGEALSLRLMLASLLILGGIGLTIFSKRA